METMYHPPPLAAQGSWPVANEEPQITRSHELQTTRVLLICHDLVGPQMAGPGIRYWELSHVLARQFQVILAIPEGTSLASERVELFAYRLDDPETTATLEQLARGWADVVVSSGHLVQTLRFLRDLATPWVADVYIPAAIESLAWHAYAEPNRQMGIYRSAWNATRDVVRHADFFICASERQRDFWLGALCVHGRLHPELYTADSELRNLIDVVPFGCPEQPPRPGPALKAVWAGISPQDRVILWGGGVWNWFDPITLLRAMPQVVARHPGAKLVFLGADHPDSTRVPEMEGARQARALSRDMGLEGRHVFWGTWVPYAERGAYLLEADIGVSLHGKGIESRLSFRTRLLDSIWAGLPTVLTRGDVLAEELKKWGVGHLVDSGSVDQVAQALNSLLDEPDARFSRREAFEQLRNRYQWDRVAEPLVRFCQAPHQGVAKPAAMALDKANAKADQATLQAEVDRLQQLVTAYESGRLMRMLAALHQLRESLQRRPVR